MATSVTTPYQADVLKTASAIIHVINDNSMHDALRQTRPLGPDQISLLARRFTEGLDRWTRDVNAGRQPNPVDTHRIAIVAGLLSQKYPTAIPRDERHEITLPVSDIVEAWNNLSGDLQRYGTLHQQWESLILALFGPDPNAPSNTRRENTVQAAESFGMAVARSVGLDGIFNKIFSAGTVPEVAVPALPNYPPTDERSNHLQLMAKLQTELAITEGLLQVLTPDEPHEDHQQQLLQWIQQRTTLVVSRVTDLVIPSGLARFSSQLQDSQKVLEQSRDLLKTCLYGTEVEVANEAAQHAVERSLPTIIFLAICPNIPFLIPTLELRLAITKPLYYVTRAAHETLGKIWVFGFLFLLLRWIGEAIDAIPRFQVRLVQGIVTDGWMGRPRKRASLIHRYLRYADRRATKPRVDALQRILIGIVS
ncbi:MAG: hypothetical protein H0X24_21895 [Ktedonobacterales bacterium]|nr:hypothetical protein [Ktedonobacterales bacterium]